MRPHNHYRRLDRETKGAIETWSNTQIAKEIRLICNQPGYAKKLGMAKSLSLVNRGCKTLLARGHIVPPILCEAGEFLEKNQTSGPRYEEVCRPIGVVSFESPIQLDQHCVTGYCCLEIDTLREGVTISRTTILHLFISGPEDFGWVYPGMTYGKAWQRISTGQTAEKQVEGYLWRMYSASETVRGSKKEIGSPMSSNGLTLLEEVWGHQLRQTRKSQFSISNRGIQTDSKALPQEVETWTEAQRGWIEGILQKIDGKNRPYGEGENELIAGGRVGLVPAQLYRKDMRHQLLARLGIST